VWVPTVVGRAFWRDQGAKGGSPRGFCECHRWGRVPRAAAAMDESRDIPRNWLDVGQRLGYERDEPDWHPCNMRRGVGRKRRLGAFDADESMPKPNRAPLFGVDLEDRWDVARPTP